MPNNNPKDGKKGQGLERKQARPKAPIGKSWFLGVGINHYLDFSPLNNAVKDVKDLLILLQDQYGFDPQQVITLFDQEASRENIIDQLDTLVEKVGSDDKLLIYFSGHGHLNSKTGLAYWIPQDARKDRTYGYISNSTVRDYIKAIPALHTLLISDSCFSGTLFVRGTSRSDAAFDELEQRRSRWGIVSGRHDEEVYDGEPGTNSPFAASILKVLTRNRESSINVARLADRVVEMTRSNYEQLPEGNPLFGVGHDGGQYVFRLRKMAPVWKKAWQVIQQLPEQSLNDLHAKIVRIDAYIDQHSQAENLTEAYQLGELLEQKRAFFLAKGSMFRLKQFSRKQTPFQEEAKKLLLQYKAGYEQPVEDQEIDRPPTKQPVQKAIDRLTRKPTADGGPEESLIGDVFVHSQSKTEGDQGNATFTDPRDGQTYKIIELNGLRWMAQNLNFDVGEGCWFYENDPKKGEQYGRLYTWDAAKEACPPGWRLPTDEEWKSLAKSSGGYYDYETRKDIGDPNKGYTALVEGGRSGLSAKLGGNYYPPHQKFSSLGFSGGYWSATEEGSAGAWRYDFNRSSSKLHRSYTLKSVAISCCCVQGTLVSPLISRFLRWIG